ncbi:YchJ family metal-binding protein [Bdellovibrio bacteriovorus]|uniref:YchJ family protein n=1 Tax=Bdellovibrio bacteriovorus TaxID=959 RepID=UPI0021D0AADE|nr:YchJ family metal-binding protein [Bdellovibrio bacteriovorus]UXR65004.1 YchJ family metal-binding protein [Bdellovibrio bacteriovorus]
MKCPCGSDKNYSVCCGVYHSGEALAPTAEALMRSRYAAFAKNQMQYLRDTTDPQTLDLIDDEANKEWAERAKFLKLEILNAEEKGTKGLVEFKAFYSIDDEDYVHHEVSTFRKQAGEWFFKSGKIKGEKTK